MPACKGGDTTIYEQDPAPRQKNHRKMERKTLRQALQAVGKRHRDEEVKRKTKDTRKGEYRSAAGGINVLVPANAALPTKENRKKKKAGNAPFRSAEDLCIASSSRVSLCLPRPPRPPDEDEDARPHEYECRNKIRDHRAEDTHGVRSRSCRPVPLSAHHSDLRIAVEYAVYQWYIERGELVTAGERWGWSQDMHGQKGEKMRGGHDGGHGQKRRRRRDDDKDKHGDEQAISMRQYTRRKAREMRVEERNGRMGTQSEDDNHVDMTWMDGDEEGSEQERWQLQDGMEVEEDLNAGKNTIKRPNKGRERGSITARRRTKETTTEWSWMERGGKAAGLGQGSGNEGGGN
ncbi:hypothetical protein C8R44DRAFT_735918 [Mycena epipterygia]|nr:hypothetical protein C8R44DRAFT_735918 [Mycena epipterygia]